MAPQFPIDASAALKRHIKLSERLMLTAYFDAAGVPTIGWGHIKGVSAADVRTSRTITEAQAEHYFEDDLDGAEMAVRAFTDVSLNQNQYDALVDFVFNLGPGAYRNSTLLKLLNAGNYDAVPAQLARWTKAKDPKTKKLRELRGLVTRRKFEADLWQTPAIPGAKTPSSTPSVDTRATTSPVPTSSNTSLWTILIEFFLKLIVGGSRV